MAEAVGVDVRSDAEPARRVDMSKMLTTLGPLVALIVTCAFFSTQSDRFLTGSNFSLIFQQVVVVAVLAIGQTIIIITGGIDLSNGMVMAFGSIVMTKLAVVNGVNPYLAIAAGLGACAAFGYVNGTLVTRLRLPPFIVTLGMLSIANALTHKYSEDKTIPDLPEPLTFLGSTFQVGSTRITYGSVLTLLLFAIAWYVLTQTASGRHVYAIGNNVEAARLAGIRTDRTLRMVYTVAGVTFGIGALLLVARTGVGEPQAGAEENLQSITAVVLGGTSLFGGRGSVIGTLFGALIVSVFRNGLLLRGSDPIDTILITGILVILAVAVDQFSRRRT
jgi:fructose transport system permease protein